MAVAWSPQVIGSIVEYMCVMAFQKFNSRSRGEAIWKRLLNKKFLMDVSDKENMQRFEVGILGPVEKDEIEGYIRDLYGRGIARDGPDGLHIPTLEIMGEELSAENSVVNSADISEAEAVLREVSLRAAMSRKTGTSNKVQRTSPSKMKWMFDCQHTALLEVQLPNGKLDGGQLVVADTIEKTMVEGKGNDENQWDLEEALSPKRGRYH